MTDERVEGMQARAGCKRRTANPHSRKSGAYVEWLAGFDAMDTQIEQFLWNAHLMLDEMRRLRRDNREAR